jgi:arylsulfatase A-like enzyme
VHGLGQGFRVWKTPWRLEQEEQLVGRDAAVTSDAAIDYVASAAASARPFLLYAHYQCVHAPYMKHPEWDFGDTEVDRYDSALAYCDEQVGRLVDAVDARAGAKRTIIVLFSDHGELLGEQGQQTHGTSLLEPAVRSLLLVRVAGHEAQTIDAPVTLTDLTPTLIDLVGASPMRARGGWSLVPFLSEHVATASAERPVFLYADDWRGDVHYYFRGVIQGDFKYVRDVATGADQLFDERTDPDEANDLRSRLPEMRGQLATLVEAWSAHAGAP